MAQGRTDPTNGHEPCIGWRSTPRGGRETVARAIALPDP